MVSPDRVHSLLDKKVDLGWYQLDVNVGMDRLTGPFDFTTVQTDRRRERWRISDDLWEDMIEEANKMNVQTDDVDRKPRPKSTGSPATCRVGWKGSPCLSVR